MSETRFCLFSSSSIDTLVFKRKTNAGFVLLRVTRRMSLGKAVKDVTLQGSGKGLTACGPREMACSPADTWGCGDGETPQHFFFLTWPQIIQHVYTKRLIYYIMKRSTTVFFSHGNFYATVLCFGAGFYHTSHGTDGARVTTAVQSSKGTCIFWKCEMMRYSCVVCFHETPV